MNNMQLPFPLPSGKSWTEEIPPGSMQRSSASFGETFGKQILNIKIDGSLENLQAAIPYIVGYSTCMSRATGKAYDPNFFGVQTPYYLSRETPARHPTYPNLVATQILSVQGGGLRNRPNDGGAIPAGAGTAGEYQYVWMSIQFEIPRYPILDNDELQISHAQDGFATLPEYFRYTEWEFEEAIETLARKGQTWYFTDPKAIVTIAKGIYNGDRLLRVAKGNLKVTTYNVAMDYVYLGRICPTNGLLGTSTVNARPFPAASYRDQNFAAFTPTQFPPGTLLELPSRYTPHAMTHPAVLKGEIDQSFSPGASI